jgi:hypothetical protein
VQIVSAEVCDIDRTVCAGEVIASNPSRAIVRVKNNGTMAAPFMASVDDCSYPVIPVPAQTFNLSANGTAELMFEVLQPFCSCCKYILVASASECVVHDRAGSEKQPGTRMSTMAQEQNG